MNTSLSSKSGFVSLLGKPNVGKSTLLNSLLGEKIAATTPKPQTTRDRIRGILTLPNAQVVFVDTPGVHRPTKALNQYMVDEAFSAIPDSDLHLFVIDVVEQLAYGPRIHPDDQRVLEVLGKTQRPVIVVFNKADRLKKQQDALQALLPIFDALATVVDRFVISATQGDGLGRLVGRVLDLLPAGPFYYPEDQVTELPLRFLCAELIREAAMTRLEKEVPYALAVQVETFHERDDKPLVEIGAVVIVERQSQKGIVIGKGGQTLKRIGSEARVRLEEMLEKQVFLSLFVKVEPEWTRSGKGLRKVGYE